MKHIVVDIKNYTFEVEVDEDNEAITSSFTIRGRFQASLTEREMKDGYIIQKEIFDGTWRWLLAKDRVIELPTHNIKIGVEGIRYDGSVRFGCGYIVNENLKTVCKHCNNPKCDFDCEDAQEWASDRDRCCQTDKNEELASERNYNYACDAILSIVLAHAIAGLDIEAPAYLEGLETAIDGISNNI